MAFLLLVRACLNIACAISFLASGRVPPPPALAPQEKPFGILCDPEMSWATFSTTATGFGGLTLAELIKPGVIYLKSAKLR